MTSTDRAFIAAYQQSTAVAPTSEATPITIDAQTVAEPKHSAAAKPHFLRARRSRRAPLSDLIAARQRTESVERSGDSPTALPEPAMLLRAFTWPEAALRLSSQSGAALVGALKTLGERVVTLVGARAGAGVTTATLAMAHAAERAGLRVMVLDANPVASDLAYTMGVHRLRTLAEAAERGEELRGCVAGSRQRRVSLAIGAGPISPATARRRLATLAEAYDLVAVDGGLAADGSPTDPPSPWVRAAGAVTLVTAKTDDAEERSRTAALSRLAAARIAVRGVVENFAHAA